MDYKHDTRDANFHKLVDLQLLLDKKKNNYIYCRYLMGSTHCIVNKETLHGVNVTELKTEIPL